MSITVAKKYLKGEVDSCFYPTYIISPPAQVPELEGYVLKIFKEYVEIKEKNITLFRGNEWNKKAEKIFYTFEKEVKEKGKTFKRYRYTEEELLFLYRAGENSKFEETLKRREETTTKGPGFLIKASYTDYDSYYGREQKKGWFILSSEDEEWIYPFDYEPLRDLGKHSTHAKGFCLLEKYQIEDIALLRTNAKELKRLTGLLDHYRGLRLGESEYTPFIKHLVDAALHLVPIECREEKGLKSELNDAAKEMEKTCESYIYKYKKERIQWVSGKIKNLIGIDIDQNL